MREVFRVRARRRDPAVLGMAMRLIAAAIVKCLQRRGGERFQLSLSNRGHTSRYPDPWMTSGIYSALF